MRWVLIVPIKLYRLMPVKLKRRCLFRETCSLFVMRRATEDGLWAGCHAFSERFIRCRKQYSVCYDYAARDWLVLLADGSAAASSEVADFILEPYRAALAKVETKVRETSIRLL